MKALGVDILNGIGTIVVGYRLFPLFILKEMFTPPDHCIKLLTSRS
jgi:hypothetical protein